MKQIGWLALGVLVFSFFILRGAVSSSAAVEPDGSVVINEANFPDKTFRTYVASNQFDVNQNGMLEKEEREQQTYMTIGGRSDAEGNRKPGEKYSCRGIDYFPNIKSLTIIEIDCLQERMEGLPRLESVSIWNWENKKLTLQEIMQKIPVKQIKRLELRNCEMDVLDLSQNKKIEEIQIEDMKIPSGVKLSDFKKLREVTLGSTHNIKKLDLSRNRKLEELIIFDASQLKSLILPQKGMLKKCSIEGNNQLKGLDLTAQKKLKTLVLGKGTGLKKLDLSKNKRLKDLILLYPDTRFKLPQKSVLQYITLNVSNTTVDLSACGTSLRKITNQAYGSGAKIKMKRDVFEKLWNSSDFSINGVLANQRFTKENKKINIPKKGKYIYVSI